MKIGQKNAKQRLSPTQVWLAVLLLVFVAGVVLGEWGLAQTVEGAWSETASWLRQGNTSANLPALIVDMPFENYNLLLVQREEALTTGVFIAAESDFLTADIRFNNDTIPIRLRLRQGTAVHLDDDEKWNFDIRTRNDQLFMDMQRFYLIDPADNNWLNEWAFSQTLHRENILVPRYQFVQLIFNGDDRGIYALQEGFGPELMTAQDRPEGVIVEFDATRLWQAVADAAGDAAVAQADPITNLQADAFQYFEVDTFRDATIARDEILAAQKNRAIGLLRSLQNGALPASDVFDVTRYGRYLALVDLWGATQATSLVNLRYYYHPETGKLEPIGFNAAPTPQDLSQRISLAATYNDPALQTAYVTALQQFSQPEYLAALQAEMEAGWQTQQQAVGSEIELQPPWEQLSQRQTQMRRSLDPLQPVFAYLGPPSLSVEAIIQIDIVNVLNVPVEIIGFDIDGATFLEIDRAWLQGDGDHLLIDDPDRVILKGVDAYETAVLQFVRFHIPLTKIIEQDSELDFMQEPTISVATRILGLDDPQLTAARPGYPDPLFIPGLEQPSN